MELIKKQIHMQKVKTKAVLQIPIEEDINVSDINPDVDKIILSDGVIKIEEIKTGINRIWVRGKLCYKILYQSDGKMTGLSGMEGEIPFLEEIAMEGIETTDKAVCNTKLEDIRVSMINSRKLNIQAVISLLPYVEKIADTDICNDLHVINEGIEYRKKDIFYLENVISKKDLFRIHEESKLPASMPDMEKLIWKSIKITDINFRPLNDKLNVNGDASIFIIYQDINGENNWYETNIPFSGVIDCQGSLEGMISDISYNIEHEEIMVKDDSDGEARNISVEVTFELDIVLSNQETTTVVSDVYGVTCEVDAITSCCEIHNMLHEINIEEKHNNTIVLEPSDTKITQICYQDCTFEVKDYEIKNDQLIIHGNENIRIMYLTGEDNIKFEIAENDNPVEITKQIQDITKNMECIITPQIEQFQVMIKDSNVMEWKGILKINVKIISRKCENILSDIKISELDTQKQEKLPGFAIYFVKQGDSLWTIGKKFYVSVDKIKEVNQLSNDDIKVGDKLLIVKSGDIE